MSLDQIGQELTPGYNFASQGIESYISEFQKPLQNTYPDRTAGLDDVDNWESELSEGPIDVQATAAAAKATGQLLATVTDATIPALLAIVAKTDEISRFKASASERDELVIAWTNYSRLKGGDIPPGIALLLALGGIYGTKIPSALLSAKQAKEGK